MAEREAPARIGVGGWIGDARDLAAGTLVLVLAIVNAVLLPQAIEVVHAGGPAVDWLQFVEGGRRVVDGDLYEVTNEYGYRWSPIAAYLFAILGPMGTLWWRILHVAAAVALPTWPMRMVTLAAWPFWYDVESGNVMVFVLLAAAWAVRGNGAGIVGFTVLAVLVPRPLMLPVLAWLFWRRPGWRVGMLAIIATHGIATLGTGWGGEWAAMLLELGREIGSPNNLGPTRLLGPWWLLIGIPLAVVLIRKGRLGWASLAASYPYVLPYYLLMLILELPARFSLGSRLGGRP